LHLQAGARFSKHTDAYLPERLGVAAEAVAAQPRRFPNRFCTVFVYLNDAAQGGCTRWGWLEEAPAFYGEAAAAAPAVGTSASHTCGPTEGGATARAARGGAELRVRPRRGLAVVHFPCTRLELGGRADPNAAHESEVAVDTKCICQQFIWSARPEEDEVDESVRLYWHSFRSDEPARPLTEEVV
jgi:hypothetical protein